MVIFRYISLQRISLQGIGAYGCRLPVCFGCCPTCICYSKISACARKGLISISISLHQTSFCFICNHLTSGEKDGDEFKMTSDVMEILRKSWDENSPQTIVEH